MSLQAIKGKAEGMPKLIAEVKAMQGFEDVSKRQIEATIKNIAVKEKRGSDAVSGSTACNPVISLIFSC
jgi:hypothetical protein